MNSKSIRAAARLSVAASVLILAACGGGGGGGAPATNVISGTGGGTTTPPASDPVVVASNPPPATTTPPPATTTPPPATTTPPPASDPGVFAGDTPPSGSTGTTTPPAGTGSTDTTTPPAGTTPPPAAPPFAKLGGGSTGNNQFGTFTSGGAVSITGVSNRKLTAPVAATKGTNPTAAPAGATQTLPTGPAFPLTQTIIQINASGISPANTVVVAGKPSPLDGGATLTVTSWNPTGSSDFTLSIPGLGIVGKTISSPSLLKGASTFPSNPPAGTAFRLTASNVNYAALGLWEQDANGPDTIFLGTFVTGYETPVSGMPTSGTASFGGTQNVAAVVSNYQSDGQLARASVLGDGTYTANFGTATLTGSFTNMKVLSTGVGTTSTTLPTPTPWNDVSVSASIIAASNRFSGSATAGAQPAGAFAVTGGASGKFDGAFYGPAADELAGVWSLVDSANVVIGVAHGKQH